MTERWTRRIERAAQLADEEDAARELLLSYRQLLELQRDCYFALRALDSQLTGSLERDLPVVCAAAEPMIPAVAAFGPGPVAETAVHLLASLSPELESILAAGWRSRSRHSFFQKLVLQPYAEHLAVANKRPIDRGLAPRSGVCPFCGGAAQLAILQSTSVEDGATRSLSCGTCATTWRVGRFFCPECGEEDERHLAYYEATAFAHLRVEACDTCRHYLKSVDLTRFGLAEPVVDEVAGGALDLWATEHGYRKIELNLIGL